MKKGLNRFPRSAALVNQQVLKRTGSSDSQAKTCPLSLARAPSIGEAIAQIVIIGFIMKELKCY
jgi:hypothetical protein